MPFFYMKGEVNFTPQTIDLSSTYLFLFVALATASCSFLCVCVYIVCMLILALSVGLVYIIIGIFCLASSVGLYNCLWPFVRRLPFGKCR